MKLRKLIYCLLIIYPFCSSFAIQKVRTKSVGVIEEVDISSNITKNKSMVIFGRQISSNDNLNTVSISGKLFGGAKFGIFNADNIISKDRKFFTLQDNVRIRTNLNFLIFAKKFQFNKDNTEQNAENVQIFFNNNTSVIAKKMSLENKDDEKIYNLENLSTSICGFKQNLEELSQEREKTGENYEKSHNILEPKLLDIVNTKNTYKQVAKKYNNSTISVHAEGAQYNTKSNVMHMKNMKLKIARIPVFYTPRYNIQLNHIKYGKTGFLVPDLHFAGGSAGVSLPVYFRFGTNSDLHFIPTFYFNAAILNKNDPSLQDDQNFRRSHIFRAKFRHLFYEANEKHGEGRIFIDAAITSRTHLIDNSTRLYQLNKNGEEVLGSRWHIKGKMHFGITKDIFVKGEIFKISDLNYLPLYMAEDIRYNFMHYKRQYAGIYHSNEFTYNSFEIMRFDPMLLFVSGSTNPLIIPELRSRFEKKIDNILGGRVIFDQRYVNLTRTTGYSTDLYNLKAGYILPVRNRFGHYLRLFGSYNLDYQKSSFAQKSSAQDGLLYATANPNDLLNSAIMQSRLLYQGFAVSGSNFTQFRNYYNFSIDYAAPFFIDLGKVGQFVIEPRFMYKQAPYLTAQTMALEDSLGVEIQTANLFSNNISDGYSMVESGKRVSYGLDIRGDLGFFDLKFVTNYGAVHYIDGKNPFFTSYNGFNGNMTDFVGKVRVYNKDFYIENEYRFMTNNPFMGIAGMFVPRFNRTTFSFDFIEKINLNLSYTKSSLIPFGQNGSIENFTIKLAYNINSKISVNGIVMFVQPKTDSGNDEATILSKGFGLTYKAKCFFYGLQYLDNTYLLPNVPSAAVMLFKLGFSFV